jgi:putative transposase
MKDHRRDVALFRYSLIREAADPVLSHAERGLLVRALAERDHSGPTGERVRVGRSSLDRWIRAWRIGGFDALAPAGRTAVPFTAATVLDLAVSLKLEAPGRTAAQVAEVIGVANGWSPSARTIQRLFARQGLNTRPDGTPPAAFGRFEAVKANDRWTGDALHGPVIGGAKAFLFAFIDDHSRAITGFRWGYSEDTIRLEAALRHALAARGIPASVYVDNGSCFVAAPLLRACAVLGIRLVHSRPGRPEGRGKIERFFRTVRDQFLVEILVRPPADLIELNRLFAAWVETVYHQRVHTETGQTPIGRYLAAGPFTIPTPDQLHEAFLWSETRTVTKTATVSLHGNTFEVDAVLVGRKVECVFDPFDLTRIEIRYQNRAMGFGVPQIIGRHTRHPMVKPDPNTPKPVTGIDYLNLVAERHTIQLARLHPPIDYSALIVTSDPNECAGQLQIPTPQSNPQSSPQ